MNMVKITYSSLAILLIPFGFIDPKILKLFGFPIFRSFWRRLFQKRVVRTKFDVYVFITTDSGFDEKLHFFVYASLYK